MQNLDLIMTFTGGLTAALVFGYATHRIGLSPIVGYLLAGIVIGPYTPGFVANKEFAEQFAEIGVILLMFGVGLQFHLKELLEVKRIAIPGAIGQSLIATALGYGLALYFNWSGSAGLVFGLALSVASTVVLLRILSDHNDLHTQSGHIAVGWLVVEDIFTVLVLVLLPILFVPQEVNGKEMLLAVAIALLKLVGLVAFTGIVGSKVIPKILTHIVHTRSRELFTLTVLVLALGIAVASTQVFGVSMALGAFLAGMVVGRSDFSLRAASEALPMRDAFAVLFFVSVGMLFNPYYLWESPYLILATLAIVLIGKPLTALMIVLFLGYPLRTALVVSIALAQIGEFSFILATLGRDLNILPESANNALVVSSIISITLNPFLYRLVDSFEKRIRAYPRLWRYLNRRTLQLVEDPTSVPHPLSDYKAIVVGYGRVGETLTRLLQESGVEPVIVELNLETLKKLRGKGLTTIYGDICRQEIQEKAGMSKAFALILSSSNLKGSEEVIRIARELNPKIYVFARSNYLSEVPKLRKVGADAVFSAEGEIALSMTGCILEHMGATPEQIERERERIHSEMFVDKISPLLFDFPLNHSLKTQEPAIASKEPTIESKEQQQPIPTEEESSKNTESSSREEKELSS
jgi:CPA2 family monovalent cation:H+ antiporter-2